MKEDVPRAEAVPKAESLSRPKERPILVLAARLDAEQRLFDGAEQDAAGDDPVPKRIAALEASIAALEAQDIAEATVQLMLAGALAERLREGLVANEALILTQIEALIRSVLSALCRNGGFDLKPYGGDYYLPAAARF